MKTLQIHQKTILFLITFSIFNDLAIAQTPTVYISPENAARAITPVHLPDLIVTGFVQTGASFSGPNGTIHVPVKVTVKNNGQAPAAIFKTGVDYQHPNGQFYPVAFMVTVQSNIWYPFTNTPLAIGGIVYYQGVLAFNNTLRGKTLSVKAIADSCSGDEFMESYCRVRESSETNNASAAISIVLR